MNHYGTELMSSRRRRRRNMSYQGFLAGEDMGLDPSESGAITGAESGVGLSSDVWRTIGIGVATGAITFLLNRWLERLFK